MKCNLLLQQATVSLSQSPDLQLRISKTVGEGASEFLLLGISGSTGRSAALLESHHHSPLLEPICPAEDLPCIRPNGTGASLFSSKTSVLVNLWSESALGLPVPGGVKMTKNKSCPEGAGCPLALSLCGKRN